MAIDTERGQATAEALAALALIALMGTAVVTVGRLQWRGLEASQATRVQAFRYALGDRGPVSEVLTIRRSPRAAPFPGPGGGRFAALRRELGVEDGGMVSAHAATAVPLHRHHGDPVIMRRHTAILADAGHGTGDEQAQQRIAASRVAWRQAARDSLAIARRAASRLKDIDRGWLRPTPNLDWLMSWADLVPADRLGRPDHRDRRVQ